MGRLQRRWSPDCYLIRVTFSPGFPESNRLYRNNGAGSFTDTTTSPLGDQGEGTSGAWFDSDCDSDLDLYLGNWGSANRLFRNDGGGSFTDNTPAELAVIGTTREVRPADYDNDGDMDIYLVQSNEANQLLRNDGNGVFVNVASGQLATAATSRDAAWGDYDNDGDLDLYLVKSGNFPENILLRNDGADTFVDVTSPPLDDPSDGSSAAWGDCDNDGDLDLFVGTVFNKVLRNDGSGVFVDVSAGTLATARALDAEWGDYDADGDLDLYLVNNTDPDMLLRNDSANGNHWIQFILEGTTSNPSAIGARVRLVAGGVTQVRQVTFGGEILAFGLGATSLVDSVEVHWPCASPQLLTDVQPDVRMQIIQPVATAIAEQAVPAWHRLYAGRPNPFNPQTIISFDIASDASVVLEIHDIRGRQMVTLVDRPMPAGSHEVRWSGRDRMHRTLPSGVYISTLTVGEYRESRALVLLK